MDSKTIRGLKFTIKGGEHSGHHGHAGRPGEVGGSAPGGTMTLATSKDVVLIQSTASEWKKEDKMRGMALNAIADNVQEGKWTTELLRTEEKINGAISLDIDKKANALIIYTMATAPGTKGVGTHLVRKVGEKVLGSNLKGIYATPIMTSEGFFRKLGFVHQPDGSYFLDREGITALG